MSERSTESHCNFRGDGPLFCQTAPSWIVTRRDMRIGYCYAHVRDRVGALTHGLDAGEKLIVERTR